MTERKVNKLLFSLPTSLLCRIVNEMIPAIRIKEPAYKKVLAKLFNAIIFAVYCSGKRYPSDFPFSKEIPPPTHKRLNDRPISLSHSSTGVRLRIE
jgi:hypothetical protein